MKLKTRLIHWKLELFGEFLNFKNGKEIPCRNCEKEFISHLHYRCGGLTYDTYCPECKEKANEKQ